MSSTDPLTLEIVRSNVLTDGVRNLPACTCPTTAQFAARLECSHPKRVWSLGIGNAMKLFKQIVQVFKGSRSNPETASEYVPCHSCDWREPLLIEAARKHGKPFKCAGDDLPREVILGGRDLVD